MTTRDAVRSPLVRTAGKLCIAGGALGALAGVVGSFYPPAVGIEQFSYPYPPAGHIVAEACIALSHLLVLGGLLALTRSRAIGPGRVGGIGIAVAAIGFVGLTLCEFVAMTFATAPYPSPGTDALDSGYGVATIVIGIGSIVAGVAVVRARVWTGWSRYVLLATGIAVLVVIPAIMGPFVVARIALTVWTLLYVALGASMVVAPCSR